MYERSTDTSVREVQGLLAARIDPQNPQNVSVGDPSSTLKAKATTEGAFSMLLLGLGGIALLVGGVGVANTVIISVPERRHEIGLRRSLGAIRGQIRNHFVTESLMLSGLGLGGIAGVTPGAAATGLYASTGGLPWVVPPGVASAGFTAGLAIGTVAGLCPAVRASRQSPTPALAGGVGGDALAGTGPVPARASRYRSV